MMKAKVVALFMVPAATAYMLAAGYLFNGDGDTVLSATVLKHAAVLTIVLMLVQDLSPRSFKEAVVHLRIRDRVPGHRAFVRRSSDRFNLDRITNIDDLSSKCGAEQQDIFYRMYGRHRDQASVAAKSFRYVAWRDTAALWFLLTLLTLPIALMSLGKSAFYPALQLSGLSLIGYLAAMFAARTNADDLVTQVLACETSEHPHDVN